MASGPTVIISWYSAHRFLNSLAMACSAGSTQPAWSASLPDTSSIRIADLCPRAVCLGDSPYTLQLAAWQLPATREGNPCRQETPKSPSIICPPQSDQLQGQPLPRRGHVRARDRRTWQCEGGQREGPTPGRSTIQWLASSLQSYERVQRCIHPSQIKNKCGEYRGVFQIFTPHIAFHMPSPPLRPWVVRSITADATEQIDAVLFTELAPHAVCASRLRSRC